MKKPSKIFFFALFCLSILIGFGLSFQIVFADSHTQNIPPGFSLILSDEGTELYQKDYPGGNPDFVQVVNLSKGATIVLLHGEIVDPDVGNGRFEGYNPLISSQNLGDIWHDFSMSYPNAFCLTNAQFFNHLANPTTLAFPLKKDGVHISGGHGDDNYSGKQLIFEIWDDRVDIKPLTNENLYGSSAPNILGGLTEDADKQAQESGGRTFVGISDRNNDGKYEIVLIFNTRTAKQFEAVHVLREFGAEKIIMFDGGGSTQLICQGQGLLISSSREIPQSLGVVSKEKPALSATVIKQPNWPILIEGENLYVEVEIQNTGKNLWTSGDYYLENKKNPWVTNRRFPLLKDVQPGENVVFTWTTEKFSKWGIFTTEWTMSKDGELFTEPVKFSVIVIPKKLEEKKLELEEKVKEWSEEQIENIEKRVGEWIQDQISSSVNKICFSATFFLPFTVMLVVSKKSKKRKEPEDLSL